MRCTGIVRRFDDLGRIVIPKEIRRQLGIKDSEPMEIYLDTDGSIILKKYNTKLEDYLAEFDEKIVEYGDLNSSQLDEIRKHLKSIEKLLGESNK